MQTDELMNTTTHMMIDNMLIFYILFYLIGIVPAPPQKNKLFARKTLKI